jgi:alpha-galactosidase
MKERRPRWESFAAVTTAVQVTAIGGTTLSGALGGFGRDTAMAAAPDPAPAGTAAAATPPMGWNSWNTFGCNIDEKLIKGMADSIVSSGMRELGYQYVVVDDCWFDPQRDASGNLQGNPARFPSGMKALGDYLHAKGLKFGLYEVPGTKTCAQTGSYPGSTGSQGHEAQDARQFAAWGVDYLKYDWCMGTGSIDDQVRTFKTMHDALIATGRPIVFSINPNSFHAKTGPQRNWGDVANLWRTTEDITNTWDSRQSNGFPMGIQNIVNVNVPLAGNARPGSFNDPDMLEVGRGGMNDTEMRSHFALWAIMAAPLMAGNDLRNADAATLQILKNKDLIDINQDVLARQATQVSGDAGHRVLVKPLSNGDVAVALFNQTPATAVLTTTAAAAGLSGTSFTLRDAWTGETTNSTGAISATVPGHGTAVYRVRAASPGQPSTPSVSTPTPTPNVPTPNVPSPNALPGSPANAGPATCTATYRRLAGWDGGFMGTVVIAAGGSPIKGWAVGLKLGPGQTLLTTWNGAASGQRDAITVANAKDNAAIAARGNRAFGFVVSGNSVNEPTVTSCTPAGS